MSIKKSYTVTEQGQCTSTNKYGNRCVLGKHDDGHAFPLTQEQASADATAMLDSLMASLGRRRS